MKLRQVLIIAVLLLGWVNSSNAKGYKPAKVYMFVLQPLLMIQRFI